MNEGVLWAYVVRNAVVQSIQELAWSGLAVLRGNMQRARESFQDFRESSQDAQTAWRGLMSYRQKERMIRVHGPIREAQDLSLE